MRTASIRWLAILVLFLGVVGVSRFLSGRNGEERASGEGEDHRPVLKVGFLPVTCHLTCPVTDFATRTSGKTRFVSQRFTDFPTVSEALRGGALKATFMIVPLALKLRQQGLPLRLVYLGHRDGSTLIVRREDPARDLRDLRGKTFAVPSRASNQYLVVRRLMNDLGMRKDDLKFIELAPPDMPGALAARAIDAYFVGEPHAAKAELDGTGRVLHFAGDVWPHFVSCGLVVTEDLIARHPDMVEDLVRGIASSGAWAEGHRLEAAAVAASYFRQKPELLEYVLTQPPRRVSYHALTPSDQELETIQRLMVDEGLLPAPIALATFIDRRFIPDEITPSPVLAGVPQVHR
jgi:NitT/TauT family transport system substrate-binding protein